MKSFFVGLAVIALLGVLSVVGILLLPLILVLGFFLRLVIGALLILFTIWLIGKLTLLLIDAMKNRPQIK